MPRPFLTARWENVLLVNYEIPQENIRDLVPAGMQLDTKEGSAFVSFVAFGFHDTKVKGFRIPGHVNFPEINLRYYLRYKGKRGVAFVQELVPKPAIAFVARVLYNEPYRAIPMKYKCEFGDDWLSIQHDIKFKHSRDGHQCKGSVFAKADSRLHYPPADGWEYFFKEHEWGFGRLKNGEQVFYKVEHPEWGIYDVTEYNIDVDFGALYGARWSFLSNRKPHSVTLAAGSKVSVFNKQSLYDFPE